MRGSTSFAVLALLGLSWKKTLAFNPAALSRRADTIVHPSFSIGTSKWTNDGGAVAKPGAFHLAETRSCQLVLSSTENKDSEGETTTTTSPTPDADIVERPDPSILLSAQTDSKQRMGFIFICLGLTVGTYVVIDALDFVEWILPDGYFALWRDFTWPVPLGLIYMAAGCAHFALKDSFSAMVPPPGTWGGLWQVPAPGADKLGLKYEEFHNYWTGICEIGGGLLLILGGLNQAPQVPAFLLFLLTAAITPANIYMATHDIQPTGMPPIPYPLGHFYRGIMQCVLLAFFFKLAFQ